MASEFDRLMRDLNQEQKKAVLAPEGPLLVLAGAGSGKTRVLTLRIAHLISTGVPAFNVLGVTFTNKAADEMKARVSRLLHQDVWISTFHSACLKILRTDGELAGLKRNFTIYDDRDQLVLIKECLIELKKSDRQINPKGVREEIKRAKDFLLTPVLYAQRVSDPFERVVAQVYERYERKLANFNGCDFGGLILKTVFLFDEHRNALATWQDRLKHILIDEYQDTNHAQYRFTRHLADRSQNIMVVGDPDQSIYAWRGADIRNILNFENDYPSCRVIKLERNYRSTANVLDAANALIECNLSRKPKSLWTEHEEGEKISLYEARDEKDEAEFIAREVRTLVREGRTLADCVVFYRMHAQSRVIEEVLRKYKMPYQIVGGIRFYDRMEIKDLIAYLRAVAYSDDQLSLKRIMNVPNRGIGKKTMEAFETFQRAHSWRWDEALKQVEHIPGIGTKARESLRAFREMMASLRSQASSMLVSELLEEILKRTGYLKVLEAERTIESKVRIDNIHEFFSAAQDFEENWQPTGREDGRVSLLEAFIESISLTTDLDRWDQGSASLTLMTLHCAKGLEFDVVYMVGMEEEVFPHVNSFRPDVRDLEEERRLCYVGMTRAKSRLTFTYAESRRLYGFRQHNLPSRFLNEIPTSLYETITRFSPESDEEETLIFD